MSIEHFVAYVAAGQALYLSLRKNDWVNASILYMLSIILLNITK